MYYSKKAQFLKKTFIGLVGLILPKTAVAQKNITFIKNGFFCQLFKINLQNKFVSGVNNHPHSLFIKCPFNVFNFQSKRHVMFFFHLNIFFSTGPVYIIKPLTHDPDLTPKKTQQRSVFDCIEKLKKSLDDVENTKEAVRQFKNKKSHIEESVTAVEKMNEAMSNLNNPLTAIKKNFEEIDKNFTEDVCFDHFKQLKEVRKEFSEVNKKYRETVKSLSDSLKFFHKNRPKLLEMIPRDIEYERYDSDNAWNPMMDQETVKTLKKIIAHNKALCQEWRQHVSQYFRFDNFENELSEDSIDHCKDGKVQVDRCSKLIRHFSDQTIEIIYNVSIMHQTIARLNDMSYSQDDLKKTSKRKKILKLFNIRFFEKREKLSIASKALNESK